MREDESKAIVTLMIAVFGDVYVSFEKKDGQLYEKKVDGYGYSLVSKLAEKTELPFFFTALGSDSLKTFVLESLVEKRIMFDPDLSMMSLHTAHKIDDDEFFSSSALFSISEEAMSASVNMNTDINMVHVSPLILSRESSSSSVVDSISFISPSPFVVSDVFGSLNEKASRAFSSLSMLPGLVIADKENYEKTYKEEKKRPVLSLDGKYMILFFEGKEKRYEMKKSREDIVSSLMAALDRNAFDLSKLEEIMETL